MPGFDYRGQYAYHLTFVTHARTRRFEVASAAQTCVDAAHRAAADRHFDLLAYCVMPDHLHLVVQGRREGSDLLDFVKLFKQLTGYHLKTEPKTRLWQQSFRDRLLRDEPEVTEAVEYVFQNPVALGLVKTRAEYRWAAGLRFQRASHGPA